MEDRPANMLYLQVLVLRLVLILQWELDMAKDNLEGRSIVGLLKLLSHQQEMGPPRPPGLRTDQQDSVGPHTATWTRTPTPSRSSPPDLGGFR